MPFQRACSPSSIKGDQTAFIYRVIPYGVSHATTKEQTPPLVLRLSATHAKWEMGSDQYSQVIGERPWQIVSNTRNKNKPRVNQDKRYKKNNLHKPQETGANKPLDLSGKGETPDQPLRMPEATRKKATSQKTYADMVKSSPESPPQVTSVSATQV